MVNLSEIDKVFLPFLARRIQDIQQKSVLFAHYTSATTAIKIIQNGELWMRSVMDMNDLSEVDLGYDLVLNAFAQKQLRKKYDGALKKFGIGIDELIATGKHEFSEMKKHVFVTCLSEHKPCNSFGRLSMWRAYAPVNGVTLIMDSKIIAPHPQAGIFFGAVPILYLKPDDKKSVHGILNQIALNLEKTYINIGSQECGSRLLGSVYAQAASIKHIAFKTEREWRLVLSASSSISLNIAHSSVLSKGVEDIGGLLQPVYKLNLNKLYAVGTADEGYSFISRILKKIIIGPSRNSALLHEALCDELYSAGISEPQDMVEISGIPLRL